MLEFKDKELLVNNVISAISARIEDIDFSDGEPLRTFIEAVMQEIDIQYWQLEQVYALNDIDKTNGDDLTDLVKILGQTRKSASKSIGQVKFFRETPATLDYLIPAGTLVETLPNASGEVVQFETIENVSLLTGQTQAYANIQAVNTGKSGNVVANKIIVINNPPIGIESVTNEQVTSGGEEQETDEELRQKTKTALETAGMGTILALKNKINEVYGIKSVTVNDMARGIGTVDILVLGDTLPMPIAKLNEVKAMAEATKAGGIDISVIEPTTSTVNIAATLTLKVGSTIASVTSDVTKAIQSYFDSLEIGETFIKNQLSKEILSANEAIIDINITSPANNITVNDSTIAILGTITLT